MRSCLGSWGKRWEKVGRVQCELKRGNYDNELSRFRYDVVLEMGEKEEMVEPEEWVEWDQEGEMGKEVEEE